MPRILGENWQLCGGGGWSSAGRSSRPRQERGPCHCTAEKSGGQLRTWQSTGCRLRCPGRLRAAERCQQLEISDMAWPEVYIKCVSVIQCEIAKFYPFLGMCHQPHHHYRQHSHRMGHSRLVRMDLRLIHWHECCWMSVPCWHLKEGGWEASPPVLQVTVKWESIFLTWSLPRASVAFRSPGGSRTRSRPW